MKALIIATIVFLTLASTALAAKGVNQSIMHSPSSSLTLELGQNFTMTCMYTSNGSGSAARANITFIHQGVLMNTTTNLNLSGNNPHIDEDASVNQTRTVFARAPGSYQVWCTASDDRHPNVIKNSSNVTINVWPAPSAPSITLLTPNGTVFNDTTAISLSFTASDDRNASFPCTTRVNGTPIIGSVLNGTTILGINASYGRSLWNVNCTDGNLSNISATWEFTVADTLPPVVSSASNVTAEATGNLTVVSYTVPNATDAKDGNVSVYCTPSGSFALGNTTITCNATDTSAHVATTTFVVGVVDTTAPSITIYSPTPTTYDAASVLVNISATDLFGITLEYRYNDSVGNSSLWADASAPFTHEFSNTTTLHARATDVNGNVATAQVTFTIAITQTSEPEPDPAPVPSSGGGSSRTVFIPPSEPPPIPEVILEPETEVVPEPEATLELPTLVLDPSVNDADLGAITGLAITDTDSVPSRRTVLAATAIAFGAAAMLFFFLRKKTEKLPEGTSIIADSQDEPLIPFTMLQDANHVLDRVLSSKAKSWTSLYAHYPPLVVHTCKRALQDVKKKPEHGELPAPADYLGAATFGRLVRVLATSKLAGEKTHLPKHVHKDYVEVKSAAEQELAILRHLKLKNPKEVDKALTLIRHGKGIVLIDVSALENNDQLKSVLKKIKRTAEANDGAVIGVGTHGLLATHGIPIDTGGAKHGTV